MIIRLIDIVSNVGLIVILLTLGGVVFACAPDDADPWYSTHISFDQSNLPAGVEIIQSNFPEDQFVLVNRSSEPFYIIHDYGKRELLITPKSGLPSRYEPLYLVVSNRAYIWERQSSADDNYEWKPLISGNNNFANDGLRIRSNIYKIDGESRQVRKDNRPSDISIPDPQNITILSFYKNNPLNINGTLSYSLNNTYDPHALKKQMEACGEVWDTNNLRNHIMNSVFMITVLAAVGIVVYSTYKIVSVKLVRRNRK